MIIVYDTADHTEFFPCFAVIERTKRSLDAGSNTLLVVGVVLIGVAVITLLVAAGCWVAFGLRMRRQEMVLPKSDTPSSLSDPPSSARLYHQRQPAVGIPPVLL